MKYLYLFLASAISIFIVSCNDQYDNIEKYAGETVYPGRFDTIVGFVGYERVELNLMKAGRIPASEIKLGKSSKTIVEYGNETIVFDSVCSWVNITGLTESKLYRFRVYTMDDYGNKSVPQEIALIPFTELDRDLVGVASPKLLVSPSTIILEWPNGLSSIVMDYKSLSYEYTDKNGVVQKGSTTGTRFLCTNLEPDSHVTINMNYKVIPILGDGSKILDTVIVSKPIEVIMPTLETPFSPAEAISLRANGINTFTSAATQNIKKLVLPLHTGTFQDLFYFPALESLDLTGEGLKNVLPTIIYNKNTVITECGGGSWQPFMIRVDKPADIKIVGLQALTDLLESGQLKNVRYIPNSMGLDEIFKPYIASGVVKLVEDDDPLYPAEVFLDPQCWINGHIQDNNWEMINYYSGSFLPRTGYRDISKFDATNETVNGDPVDLQLGQLIQNDGSNIYKCVIKMRSGSFCMALPKEYMYDSKRYRYLKFKMFCGSSEQTMEGSNGEFLQPWIRPMNHLWAFGNNSIYGQESWDVSFSNNKIAKEDIRKKWKEYTVDMSPNNYWNNNNTSNRRNRLIVFNIGHEPSSFTYNASEQVVLYFADIRFSKN